jgi:hypothetical protein
MSLVPSIVPNSEVPLETEEETIGTWGALQDQILDLWGAGIFNDSAFIYAALSIDKENGQAFDLDNFIFRWQTMPDPDTGRNKVLTHAAVLKVLEKMQKLEMLEIKRATIQLTLLEGF